MIKEKVIDFAKVHLTDDDLFLLCGSNSSHRIERDAFGKIHIKPLLSFNTALLVSEISSELRNWNQQQVNGKCFGSNAGFFLQNSAMYSPFVGWISTKQFKKNTKEEKKKFLRTAPDFVIEIIQFESPVTDLKQKMEEWIENGCLLAWLVNPDDETVWVYRKNEKSFVQSFEQTLYGYDVLKGFELNLAELFRKK